MKSKEILAGLLLVLLLSAVFIPFTSLAPDGLEKVASYLGFSSKASDSPLVTSPFAEYRLPGIANDKLSAAISGIIGALVMFGAGWGIAVLLRRWRPR